MSNEGEDDEENFGSFEFDDVFAEFEKAKDAPKPKYGDGGNLDL